MQSVRSIHNPTPLLDRLSMRLALLFAVAFLGTLLVIGAWAVMGKIGERSQTANELTAQAPVIVIDPKMAFGTGHHATTRMLLEWLEDLVHGGESVLDVGAGSGILAMAALRLGAASALGVECDPVAVDCARGYAAENGFGDHLEFRCGMLEDVDRQGELRPDLVLANLDRQTLLLLCDELARYVSHGARLLLSGILLEQEQEIVEAFSKAGAMLLRRREQEGWLALELRMAESCEGVN